MAAGSPPDRLNALLQEARRRRAAWIDSPDASADAATLLLERKKNGGRHRTTMTRLLAEANGIPESAAGTVMDYIAHLNKVLGEDHRDAIEYCPLAVEDKDVATEDGPVPRHDIDVPPYDTFLRKLKHPLAAEVVKAMQRFASQFIERQKAVKPSDITAGTVAVSSLHTFLQSMELEMRKNALWRDETPNQWEETTESIEKFMLIKLHGHLFAAHEAADLRQQDQALCDRLEALAFLGPSHLEIKSLVGVGQSLAEVLRPAVAEFVKIGSYKSTREMIDCIMAVTKVLTKILIESRKDGSLPGADEFLPALILLIKEANPRRFHTVLETVQRYRHPSKLVSEAGYVFTHVVSAVHFLETADAAALGVSVAEYDEYMMQCRRRQPAIDLIDERKPGQDDDEDGSLSPLPPPPPSSSEQRAAPPPPPRPVFVPRSIQTIKQQRTRLRGSSSSTQTSTSSDLLEAELRKLSTTADAVSLQAPRVVGLRSFRQRARSILKGTDPTMTTSVSVSSTSRAGVSSGGGGWDQMKQLDRRLDLGELGPVRAVCSFLDMRPEDLKGSDNVRQLLEEYRELAALAQDLLSVEGGGAEISAGYMFPTTPLASTSRNSFVFRSPEGRGTPRS